MHLARYLIPIMTSVVIAALLLVGVGWWSYATGLDRLAERGRSDLSVASDRLVGQLQRFRGAAVLLADHPDVIDILSGLATSTSVDETLRTAADKTGSAEISVIGGDGLIVASSSEGGRNGADLSDTSYFKRAMHAALGVHYGVEENERVFYFAAPANRAGEAPIGAVLVKVDLYAVELGWRADPQAVFFSDEAGVVFASNRSELLRLSEPVVGAENTPQSIPVSRMWQIGGHQIWDMNADRYLPGNALHTSAELPVIGLEAHILLDAGPVQRVAILQGAIAAAICLIFGAAFVIVLQRRAALAERLALQEHAKAALELRVEERTRELSEVNIDLRHEVGERLEAEAALKIAQEDLVRSAKLSALGKMSAGISHELNQPLMAIRSFAENANAYIERGQEDVAAENIGRISELARRMGRIITNLRAFARHESEPATDVDLCHVVEAVLEISESRLKTANVRVDWPRPDAAVFVRGGEVRLQQVVMNLLSNAIDAMEEVEEKRITIDINDLEGKTCLSIADTGPGLSVPEKIFDPFYSTKAVGKSEGMGLGLSISYGIVQSFGGEIRGRNGEDGGAVFTVELTPAALEKAA